MIGHFGETFDRPVGIKLMSHRVASVPSEKPKITCRGFVKSLSAWHDGELAEAARASFEAHLAGCALCARYASGLPSCNRSCEKRSGRLGRAHGISRRFGPENPRSVSRNELAYVLRDVGQR